jgi:hypothetical protein
MSLVKYKNKTVFMSDKYIESFSGPRKGRNCGIDAPVLEYFKDL